MVAMGAAPARFEPPVIEILGQWPAHAGGPRRALHHHTGLITITGK
jgi:hypothetical protein